MLKHKTPNDIYQKCGLYIPESHDTLTLTSEFTDSPNIDAVLNGDECCFEKRKSYDATVKKKN